jgi:predicted nucleic acid-binding protein
MVLDSSACLDLILDTEPGRVLHPLLMDPDPPLLAPGILWVEVGRVMRAKVGDGAVSRRAAEEALADFLDLGVEETQAAAQPLLTTDLRLARAARQHARVEVLTHLDA